MGSTSIYDFNVYQKGLSPFLGRVLGGYQLMNLWHCQYCLQCFLWKQGGKKIGGITVELVNFFVNNKMTETESQHLEKLLLL
jgi:hypothetical protein